MTHNQASYAFYRILGEALRARREEKAWSPAKLAEACGIAEKDISIYESGEKEIGVFTLCTIANALGEEPQAFLDTALGCYRQEQEPPFDRETREAGELVRHFLHIEGASRGDKFKNLVDLLKKDK